MYTLNYKKNQTNWQLDNISSSFFSKKLDQLSDNKEKIQLLVSPVLRLKNVIVLHEENNNHCLFISTDDINKKDIEKKELSIVIPKEIWEKSNKALTLFYEKI